MRGDACLKPGFSDFGFLRAKITRIAGFTRQPRTSSRHVMPHHPPRVLEILAEIERHRPLESRMELAIAAAEILLSSIVLPISSGMHLVERFVVSVGDQVARPLPSLRIARDCGPRTAL